MHIMIDCETLGLKPGSIILSIGAVAFDPQMYKGPLGAEYYAKCSPLDGQHKGLTIDASTVAWWMQQEDAARHEAFSGTQTIEQALFGLNDFFHEQRQRTEDGIIRVWSHGLTADIIWLEEVYRRLNITVRPPWNYREPRDTHTLFDLAQIDLSRYSEAGEVHHNALADARCQARAVVAAYQQLGLAPLPFED